MGWWEERVLPRVVDSALKGREVGEWRERICHGLHGEIVEIGFGGGLNVRFYPPEVASVAAVEPSDLGWHLSRRRRDRSSIEIRRSGLDGQSLMAGDATYDAALCTFTLCTIPDAIAALAEVRRVLKPGGTLHYLEHGLSPNPKVARWQHRLEPVQRRVAGGCHLTRDPAALVEEAGFSLTEQETGPLMEGRLNRPWLEGYLGVALA